MTVLYLILAFIIGYITFPVLFFFQKLLKLPVPDLERTNFHLHHSFYGLLLLIIGLIFVFLDYRGIYLSTIGIGFIVHHEVTEPGLNGIEKFIYRKKSTE